MRLLQPAAFMAVADVLGLIRAYEGEVPGIEDMMPVGARRRHTAVPHFLETLRSRERRLSGTHKCRLPMLAIGGAAPDDRRFNWITNKLFAGDRNDFAVTLESSAPRLDGFSTFEVMSNHFSYFTGNHGFDQAIEFLKKQLRHDQCKPMDEVNREARAKLALSMSSAAASGSDQGTPPAGSEGSQQNAARKDNMAKTHTASRPPRPRRR
jgi:hypothetical protein